MIGPAMIQSMRCRNLWCGVIIRALFDAIADEHKGQSDTTYYRNFERENWQNEAIEWLLYDKRGFHEVCTNANLDPDSVRRFARKVMEVREKSGYRAAAALIPASVN